MNRPQAYISFEVYEDGIDLLGIAKATLPDISYLTSTITGAGMMGNIETPLAGMIDVMTLNLQFLSVTGAASKLLVPKKHHIDLRAVEQYWDTSEVELGFTKQKHVMTVLPKKMSPGTIAPVTAADASGEFNVYYYAAFENGNPLWEIDPFNQIFRVGGVDYWADIRKGLGL